jgi:hypothetical protein
MALTRTERLYDAQITLRRRQDMTTSRLISLPAVSFTGVGEALVDATEVVASSSDPNAIEDALVALCRASYDVLLQWEVDTAASARPAELREPESWRTPIDELRVQTALAEMELRDAGIDGARAADRLVRTVTSRISGATHEVGTALAALRSELRKAVR